MKAAVFVLSACVLAHQVLLLRVLAIAYWSHAASLVVSVTMLAFGLAGVLLAIVPPLRHRRTVALAGPVYAVLGATSLALAATVDFNILQVGWDPAEWLNLALLQAIFVVPFLVGALGILSALALSAERAGPMYAANLLGSGLGALLVVPLLGLGAPETVLLGLMCTAAVSGLPVTPLRAWPLAGVGLGIVFLFGAQGIPMSPFKDLPAAPSKTVLETRFSARGRVDLVRLPHLHHAPGLSLTAEAQIPPQDGLFLDGHFVAALDRGPSTYLAHTTGALAFQDVDDDARVLLLGVGPQLARATHVVDSHADLLALARLEDRGIHDHPRAFLEHTEERFDVVMLDAGSLDPLHETPMLTVEGLALALGRTTDTGVVSVSTRLSTPPRAGLKLLATAEAVTPHVFAVRSMNRLTVVLRKQAPSTKDLLQLSLFAYLEGFDIERPVTMRPERPMHRIDVPLLPPDADYPFDVSPATDARPYFHRTFRWSRISDVLDRDVVPFVEWAFVTVLVAFLQVTLLGALLLFGPLLLTRAARAPALLFLGLGIAYMLMEMAFLARATVLLGSATLAASAVIGGFLLGSGVGSLVGDRLGGPLRRAALAAAVLALPGFFLLSGHVFVVALVSALVAFPMGMPFPAALGRTRTASVPWALAVNGFASVSATAAAPLISSTFGILLTCGTAAAIYAAIGLLARGRPHLQG
ncbi:MAG: hypothetical protein QNJ98_08695 [Planctomycetota bacterium]|nr:hypothetical protein [Planctomycetota bacterium]